MKRSDHRYPCPCCGYKTFDVEPLGTYVICKVCFWEDDPLALDDPDFVGGANRVSLRQAQKNFLAFGACEIKMVKNVRQPRQDEMRDHDWEPLK